MSQHTHHYQATPDAESPSKSEQPMPSPPIAASGAVVVADDAGSRGARYQRRLESHKQLAGSTIRWRSVDG